MDCVDLKRILWLSQKIDDKENQFYIPKIEKDTKFKLFPYKQVDELLDKMETIKFSTYIVIISGRIFPEYIDKLKANKNIYSIPLTIIFTSKKESLKKNIEKKYSKYLEHKFYNILGIVDNYKELIDKILNYSKEMNNKISKVKLGDTSKPQNYDECLIFEYVNNTNQLIFPYLYNKIMSNIKVDENSIKDFNEFILKNYGIYIKIKDLLKILYFCEDVPDDIVAKYWGKIYTLETSFYHNINNKLMKLENQQYNTFIQIFYSGFKDLSYNSNELLYRASYISEEELEKIQKNIENKNQKLNNNDSDDNFQTEILVYSRAFMSFSKKKKSALKFFKKNSNKIKILFILENESQNKMISNANFEKINEKEEEILFFPFSSFIIKNKKIEKEEKDNYYIISLTYLGIYENIIEKKIEEIKDKPGIIQELSENGGYINDVIKSQIMIKPNKNINNKEKEEEIPEEIQNDDLNNNVNDNNKNIYFKNNTEKEISNLFIKMNKEIIKEEKKEIKEIKIINQEKEEKPIENNFIKLCICKKDKPYISNLKNIFNMDIFEYNNLDEIIQKIMNIEEKESILIINERILEGYINKIENIDNLGYIPFTIIYSLNKNETNKKFQNYFNNKKYKILDFAESYKDIKEIIIRTINNNKKKEIQIEEEIKPNVEEIYDFEKDENLYKNKLKIILKNLEAKHSEIENIKGKIEKFLNDASLKISTKEIIYDELKELAIYEIYNILNEGLSLKSEKDQKFLKRILSFIYVNNNNNINDFIEYINEILNNYIDYKNMSNDQKNILEDYIIDFMHENQLIKNKKEILKEIYNVQHIITLEEFNDIILDQNEQKIFMDNNAVEYLLYRMKKAVIDNNINELDSFDINIFLEYFDKEKIDKN